MPFFNKSSIDNLVTCHTELQRLFNEVIKYYDCKVICGYRNEIDQNKAYESGSSTKKYPDSKHNKIPSLAVDVVPYFKNEPHIRWNDKNKFYEFGGYVQAVANIFIINIRWGGNWDSDDELYDQTFFDLPHFELILSL